MPMRPLAAALTKQEGHAPQLRPEELWCRAHNGVQQQRDELALLPEGLVADHNVDHLLQAAGEHLQRQAGSAAGCELLLSQACSCSAET